VLPFLAGFIIQTNSITNISLLTSIIPFILSYIEIRLSRPYKIYRKDKTKANRAKTYEKYLKILSLGTISGTVMLFSFKILVF
jgi:hypothetical protein